MLNKSLYAVYALCLGLLFQACETDLEINAPYKETTIVYGTMGQEFHADANGTEQVQDTHWVRINKSFLGDGSAFDYAQIRDSSEYANEDLTAEVQRWTNGNLQQTYVLRDTVVGQRESGIFYYPEQKVYYFVEDEIDQDSEYRIVGTAKGGEFSASTPIINNISVQRPPVAPQAEINLVLSPGNYTEYSVEWRSAKDGKRYETYYELFYREVRNGGAEEIKSIKTRIITRTSSGLNGGEDLEGLIGGEDFFRLVANTVPEDPDVQYREVMHMDFIFVAASDLLNTYMELSDPVSSIVQDRPDFTNVNNGRGLFAARSTKVVKNKELRDVTILELIEGEYTGNLKFCRSGIGGPCQ